MTQIGRPTKLTPEKQAAIVQILETGCAYEVAAQSVGVDTETIRRWIRRGEDALAIENEGGEIPEAERAFVDFCGAVKEARHQAEVKLLESIRMAAFDPMQKKWQAAAWILERTRPERYRRREVVEHQGQIADGFDVSLLTDDELEAFDDLMARAEARKTDQEAQA